MNVLLKKNILAGSHAYGFWITAFEHSMIRVALTVFRITVSRILNGSFTVDLVRTRIWPVFLVGDYIDRPFRLDSAMLESSVLWARLNRAFTGSSAWLLSVPKFLALPESRLLSKLGAIGSFEPAKTNRLAMVFALLFTIVYYLLRIILQAWLPAAQFRAGWVSGLVLALMMAASLKLITRR